MFLVLIVLCSNFRSFIGTSGYLINLGSFSSDDRYNNWLVNSFIPCYVSEIPTIMSGAYCQHLLHQGPLEQFSYQPEQTIL